jgi:hypothetical protein
MRVLITVTPSTTGWSLRYTCDDTSAKMEPRQLERCGSDLDVFPLPPAAERSSWQMGDETRLKNLLEQLAIGQADAASIRLFGSYLTAVLVGPHAALLSARPADEAIELELSVLAGGAAIQRLPWELMYGEERPLAADEKHPFALVRLVKRQARPERNPLELPLRVLFVIGQTIDDSIRPGAEYMAILRRLATTDDVVNFNTRLLMRATASEIESTVDHFKPSVVHFICHGDMEQTATLLLTDEEGGRKTTGVRRLTAPALIDLLRGQSGKAKLPTVVVLNACHTADMTSEPRRNAYRGFAESLVTLGIPVAVGMAGEVADGACRLFTSRFYAALIGGESVVLASAGGRRAALRRFENYHETMEWARPTLFVAEDVAEDVQQLVPVPGEAAERARAAARFLNPQDNPRAFCGRLECLQKYERMLERILTGSGGSHVLGFAVKDSVEWIGNYKPQYGKSRLLTELAARMTLDGVAPIVLPSERLGDPPDNGFDFASLVGQLADETRDRFNVPARAVSEAFKLGILMSGTVWNGSTGTPLDAAREQMRLNLTDAMKNISAVTLRSLLAREAATLVNDLAGKGVCHAAILVDDLHLYEDVVKTILAAITDRGFGEAPAIVPLIFTYVRRDSGNGDAIVKFMEKHEEEVLGCFYENEEIMAHRQFLLTRIADPLAVSGRRDKQSQIPLAYKHFCKASGGRPSGWNRDDFQTAIEIFQDYGVLIPANDEEIVKQYG